MINTNGNVILLLQLLAGSDGHFECDLVLLAEKHNPITIFTFHFLMQLLYIFCSAHMLILMKYVTFNCDKNLKFSHSFVNILFRFRMIYRKSGWDGFYSGNEKVFSTITLCHRRTVWTVPFHPQLHQTQHPLHGVAPQTRMRVGQAKHYYYSNTY